MNFFIGFRYTIDHNRDTCVLAKNDLLHKKKQRRQGNNGNKTGEFLGANDSRNTVGDVSSKRVTKTNTPKGKKTKSNEPISCTTTPFRKTLSNEIDEEDDDIENMTQSSIEYSLNSVGATPKRSTLTSTISEDTNDTSSTTVEQHEIQIYLETIKELSITNDAQSKIIKKREEEIKRLKASCIGK
jgi:hypothetical protein